MNFCKIDYLCTENSTINQEKCEGYTRHSERNRDCKHRRYVPINLCHNPDIRREALEKAFPLHEYGILTGKDARRFEAERKRVERGV